ncbi:MAG TPA: hypothetical protein VJ719_03405 [Chthoniobacterales bacterium]|nr:hypothetical protein [Chthoniobacterales bacterium]
MRTRLFALCVTVIGIASLRADVIPTLTSTSPTGPNFTWNYTTNVTVDQMVQRGDFFTIYDFGNFVSGSNLQPANWTFSSGLTGINPSLVTVADNPSLLNLTWTYDGNTAINGSALLGLFSVVTNTNQLRTADFAAEATRSSGPNVGTKIDNVGTISVPIPEFSTLLPILSVCGAAVAAGIPSILRRRKSR